MHPLLPYNLIVLDETNCKPSSPISDMNKSDWQSDHFLFIIGNRAIILSKLCTTLGISGSVLAFFILMTLLFHFRKKCAATLNLSKNMTSTSTPACGRYRQDLIDLDYHSGHIVPVPRTAPRIPSRHAPCAPPLPSLPLPYDDDIESSVGESARPL